MKTDKAKSARSIRFSVMSFAFAIAVAPSAATGGASGGTTFSLLGGKATAELLLD